MKESFIKELFLDAKITYIFFNIFTHKPYTLKSGAYMNIIDNNHDSGYSSSSSYYYYYYIFK